MVVWWKNSKRISERRGQWAAVSRALSVVTLNVQGWSGGLAGLAAALVLQATPVAALSCGPWDAEQAYLAAAKSDLSYSVVVGRLQFDTSLLPLTEGEDLNPMPHAVQVAAKLSGKILEARHFSRRVNVDVTLSVECVASWCGQVQSGVRYLMFVEQARSGPVVRATPCGDFIFPDGAAVRRQVLDCHRSDTCQQ